MYAYLDCFSGISGDMLLGALVASGVDTDALRAALASLPLSGYTIDVQDVTQRGISGKAVRVVTPDGQQQTRRTLSDVLAIIHAGALTAGAEERVTGIFRTLAMAEARVHGVAVEEVHFHEVGAVDAIIDVVGAVVGLELLGVEELWCSELPLTSGRVSSEHGPLPVPAPATLELLHGTSAVWQPVAAEGELVTPTGAAILASLARFGRPTMCIEHVGYGFGQRSLPWANCLRLLVGPAPQPAEREAAPDETDSVIIIEANIDDMTGEALGWLVEHMLTSGALDVTLSPVIMKKTRPGTRVQVLATSNSADALARELLRSSTTLGVRFSEWRRLKAARRTEHVSTPLGDARIKLKLLGGEVVALAAEYEDARKIAAHTGQPVHDVIARIEAAARTRYGLEALPHRGEAAPNAL